MSFFAGELNYSSVVVLFVFVGKLERVVVTLIVDVVVFAFSLTNEN